MALTWTYETKEFKTSGEVAKATHQVEIIDRQGGISGTFCGTKEGAILSINAPSRDIVGPMIASTSCTVNMVIEEDVHVQFIDALTDFEERRFIMQYKYNGNVWFTGTIFLDEVTVRYGNEVRRNGNLTPSGIFTVSAIDGLTLLKDVEYNQGPLGLELPYRDRVTIGEILGRCFDSLPTFGFGQYMTLFSNWNPDTGGRDFFSNTAIDNDILFTQGRQGGFSYRSKYEIIEEICKAFDLRLVPVGNGYSFYHMNALASGGSLSVYDLSGTSGVAFPPAAAVTTAINCDGLWRLAPDVRTYQPPLEQVKVIYKFDFNGNFLAGYTWNSTITAISCYTDLGDVPVPNDTTRLRWAGTVQFIPRETIAPQEGQYQLVFKFQIKVGDQYYVRELADDTLGYYQNFRYSAAEWTTTPGYWVEVWPHLITIPDSYEQASYAPFFITTLPVPQALDGESLSACFGHELYDVNNNLISPSDPSTGLGVEHFLDDSDLIVLDQDNNLVESTQIEKVIYNGSTPKNSRGHTRTIIFSTGPNKSSDNRLTDENEPPTDQEEWTGDQGTYPHYELLARTLMSRVMKTQEFLEGTLKGVTIDLLIGKISYDNKEWLPIRIDYITGEEKMIGEWFKLVVSDASGLPDTEEEIKFINRLPNGFGTGTGGPLAPIVKQLEGIFTCVSVDDYGIPIPDTTGWTDEQIAARIEVYKQSVGLLYYRDPPVRVDEWAWDNDTRQICLGEQTRTGDKLIIRVWVG